MQSSTVKKASPEEVAAQQEEEVRKLLPKLSRPTMVSRTETSISLKLNRGNKEEQVSLFCLFLRHSLLYAHVPSYG